MKYIVTLNGKRYEVEVEKGTASAAYLGEVQTQSAPVVETKPEEPLSEKPVKQAAPVGSGTPIKSPMPGNIIDVKVAPGSKVKAGQILFILEAMKMENEIVAPKDGTISSVSVTKGATVATDDVLCTMK